MNKELLQRVVNFLKKQESDAVFYDADYLCDYCCADRGESQSHFDDCVWAKLLTDCEKELKKAEER